MRPTQHPTNNDVLGAPKGASIDECHALPITRGKFADGTDVVISYWQPSDEERKAITDGADVQIMAMGRTHPPIAVSTGGGI